MYLPGVDRLVVTNGRSARVSLIDGHDLRPAAALTISAGADMIALDPAHGALYVESGGTDSHRGSGWLAVIDPRSGRLFVATRTFSGDPRPPVLGVLDTKDGRLIATLPSKDATENMYWDSSNRLIYTSSLDGYVQAYRERDADHYALVATVPTVPMPEPRSSSPAWMSSVSPPRRRPGNRRRSGYFEPSDSNRNCRLLIRAL